jgi:ferrous iron transport protein B
VLGGYVERMGIVSAALLTIEEAWLERIRLEDMVRPESYAIVTSLPGADLREFALRYYGDADLWTRIRTGDDVAATLVPMIAHTWSLATALSLLAWYVFAPQCLSTLVVVKRETNSWRYPLIMAGYLFALAYLAAFVTFRVASALLT